MITREQVADLRPGDVVEVVDSAWSMPVTCRGVLYADPSDSARLCLGPYYIRVRTEPGPSARLLDLTVVSRAPRPLYVNHPRTEPAPGDVVRDTDGVVWLHDRWSTWQSPDSTCEDKNRDMGLEHPLTLLVDGETGQVVP